jgi:hypothetical protein
MNRAERRWRERQATRYVLTCAVCGRAFEDERATVGAVQREHFMRLHDTAKIRFTLFDRRSGQSSVLN